MFGRSIKTVPLFELFAHVIPVKSLFLDPVIDHIASLAVNFQGPLILDMGIETAFRFTPGTEEGLAMVHELSLIHICSVLATGSFSVEAGSAANATGARVSSMHRHRNPDKSRFFIGLFSFLSDFIWGSRV